MRYLNLAQGDQTWLEYRKTKVTATDAAIIMGVDEFTTPIQRWQDKLGLLEEKYVTSAMQRGRDMEDAARDAYTAFTGVPMMPACVESTDYPWLMASLDGISVDGDLCVEIKCPVTNWKVQKVPECYWCQCQHQLLCTGHPFMDFWSFSGSEGVHFRIDKDTEWQSRYIQASSEFHQCIVNKTPPPLTERDLIQRDDYDWETASVQWLEAKRALQIAEERELEAREIIKRLCADKSVEGCGIRVRRSISKGRIEYESIEEIKQLDLESYRKPSSIKWTITEKKVKANVSADS